MHAGNIRLYVLLHFIVFIWGFTGILGKLITISEYQLVWIRMMLTIPALGIYFLFTKKLPKISKVELIRLLLSGIVIALHWIFFYGAIKKSNVSVAVTCMAVQAFFIALLQPLIFKTRWVKYELILGIIVIGGVALLVGVEWHHLTGFVYGLLSAFFAAAFTLLNASFVKRIEPVTISIYEMTGGFLVLSAYNFFSGQLAPEQLVITNRDWLWLILLATVCTAFPFVVSVWIMKNLSPYTVSITINLEPVYTILLALLFFPAEEKMSTGFYLGLTIILTAVFINGWLKSKTSKNLSH